MREEEAPDAAGFGDFHGFAESGGEVFVGESFRERAVIDDAAGAEDERVREGGGDLFDVVHRAHVKNAELFVARHEARRSSWRDVATIAAAALLFVGALALPVYVAVKILGAVL